MKLNGILREWGVRTKCALPLEEDEEKEIAWNISCIIKRLLNLFDEETDIKPENCSIVLDCETSKNLYSVDVTIYFRTEFVSAIIHHTGEKE